MGVMIWSLVVAWWLACLAVGFRLARGREAGKPPVGTPVVSLVVLRAYPLLLVAVIVVVAGLLVVGTPDPWIQGVTLVGLALVTGLALVSVALNLGGHDPDAARIAARLSADPASQRLLVRWLTRVRWRRWLGGVLGLAAGALSGASGPVVLTVGLGGLLVGSLSAEVHHLRRTGGGGPRQADLRQRRLRDYTLPGEQLVLAVVAGAGAAVLVAALLDGDQVAARWSAAALGTAGLVLGFQWRIVTRRRPALPVELGRADDLLRRLAASRGVAQPGLALGLALVAQGGGALGLRPVALVGWVAAFGWFWDGRRLGLDHLLARPPALAA